MPARFLRSLINAVHIDRAFSAAREGRHQDALDILDRKVRGADDLYYVHLLRGGIFEKLGRSEDALREFTTAHDLVVSSKLVTGPEQAYFEAFAAVAARRCAARMPGLALSPEAENRLAVRFDAVKLRQVPGKVKAYFPLPEHPKWAQD
jgi:hypothetical protein